MNTGLKYNFDNFCDDHASHTKDLIISESENDIELILGHLKKQIPLYKRIMDITIAGITLTLISPIFALVVCLLTIESKEEPIFQKSKRAGMGYKVFELLQFRTLLPNKYYTSNLNTEGQFFEEKIPPIIPSQNIQNESKNFNQTYSTNTYRETTLGLILRKTKINNLPQLINVLKGEMSVVGNRPLPLAEAQKLTSNKLAGRFIAPVGLTGLCQITRGKHIITPRVKINLEIDYAKNYSFILDMEILFKSIPALFQSSESKMA